MGKVRLILALSVVLYHLGIVSFLGLVTQEVAVRSFFIISGFYMAFILKKKYINQNSSFYLFISNRAMKIFPLYWVMLVLVFGFALIKLIFFSETDNAITHYLFYINDLGYWYKVVNILNFIFRNITLILTTDYLSIVDYNPGYLLVQQAWTLQLEFLFYLMAPFLVGLGRKSFIIFTLLYLFVVYKLLIPLGILESPSLMYSLLSNGIFFIAGIFSYQYLYNFLEKKEIPITVLKVVLWFFLTYLFLYEFINLTILYYLIFIICLPFLFISTKFDSLDRWIGEFAYPIYISHFFIIKFVDNVNFLNKYSEIKVGSVLLLTMLFSFFVVIFFLRPLNKYRQSRVLK